MSKPGKLVVGIDLHGTLLDKDEKVPPELLPGLCEEFDKLSEFVEFYLCTGNDLTFVNNRMPEEILCRMKGYILETGCVASDKTTETILTPEGIQTKAKKLQNLLEGQNFPEVSYFARRLTTVSLFCDEPRSFFDTVQSFLKNTSYAGDFNVLYSSVAVDLVPTGFDKHKGLSIVADGKETIGIADSMNDLPLLKNSNYSFSPSNIPEEVVSRIQKDGKVIYHLIKTSGNFPNQLGIAATSDASGVLEILKYIQKNLYPSN